MPVTNRQILDAKTLIEVNTLIQLDIMNQVIDNIYAGVYFELLELKRTLRFEAQLYFKYNIKE